MGPPARRWLDLNGLRVVRACWDDTRMDRISRPVTDEFLHSACLARGSLFEPVEAILEGQGLGAPRAGLTRTPCMTCGASCTGSMTGRDE